MPPSVSPRAVIEFESGTLRIAGIDQDSEGMPGGVWDDRIGCWRAPAWCRADIVKWIAARSVSAEDRAARSIDIQTGPWKQPGLRDYQLEAVRAWDDCGRRGLVVLPTGAGKTRVAIAALARASTTALILCPTRALLEQWRRELACWYEGRIGAIGDGIFQPEKVTVTTFESAFRQMDRLGDRFAMVVVDEAHHHGSGSRAEALEMSAASWRMGLTATPPEDGSAAAAQLARLVGPVVCELTVADLTGSWLAPLVRLPRMVELGKEERSLYTSGYEPFAKVRADWRRDQPDGSWQQFLKDLVRMPGGRSLLDGYRQAVDIATFPQAKRVLVADLLERYRSTQTLLFTANAEHAYQLSRDNLIPVITAETPRAERAEILKSFAAGRLRALVSARVLNEGIDVPDASVAIVVGGALGTREHVQRIGRVLRPAPGKKAIIHELVTSNSIDEVRARRRARVTARTLDSTASR